MKILAVDTSTKYATVAITEENNIVAETIMQFMAQHSEKLLPEIVHILENFNIPVESIDYYAVTVGPGSFTGLRVAVSTIKGLSFITGKKVAPVSTLEVIARAFPYTFYKICPMLDARKKEVFAALFEWKNGNFFRLKQDTVLKVENLVEWIDRETLFIGSGAELYREKIISLFDKKAYFADPIYSIPRAAIVAQIAYEKIKKGEITDAQDLIPVYLRKSEAEIKKG